MLAGCRYTKNAPDLLRGPWVRQGAGQRRATFLGRDVRKSIKLHLSDYACVNAIGKIFNQTCRCDPGKEAGNPMNGRQK